MFIFKVDRHDVLMLVRKRRMALRFLVRVDEWIVVEPLSGIR